ncbi:LysR family transcriptional regulator, hydrogen peroxide-inducible genes activator [Pseudooceanicola antarcticus]|uniref:LysR family transcriptional regulator n=1 Tax=Pseudooceanicola antarcticus TaxID=1247613 RepID=A0A285J2F0_9RHOB|nr:LysR substrate-binding domain-containing protein [Pseudooceanicola antarcticus]PJE25673.1 LysR family transcriptional regulator [Pseudooceanicola antarcticus]SNY53311.1 LysR family transcriptional regulator, hydrogen peroxide-inducible genes activator [Pseudooceanicola antarcticus]
MNLTIRQLNYFKSLATHRNFGRAAEAVHVSQPALSVQIRDMEQALGAQLVERRSRDVALTPFGRLVLAQTEKVLTEMQALKDLARWNGGLSGELRLGIIPTIAPYLLPAALGAIRADDIGLVIQVQEGKTARLLEDLHTGRLDAIVLALPLENEKGLVFEPLFEDRFLLAGTEARLTALGGRENSLRPDHIGPDTLLLLEDGHCLTDQALEVCGRGQEHAQINMGASSLSTLSRLVAAGFGLTLLPELAVGREAEGLSLRRFGGQEPSRQVALVRRASSIDDGWFRTLAHILARAGQEITEEVRAAH